MSVILGQRGVGKTTAIIQHMTNWMGGELESSKALYVQADHFLVGKTPLYAIAEEFYNIGGNLICFDEIHKYPSWSLELKSMYDTFSSLAIIASGSSALEILRGSHDLSRRALVSNMTGLSFREFIEMRCRVSLHPLPLETLLKEHEKAAIPILRTVEKKGEKILGLFRKYLSHGYYPYFLEYQDIGHYYRIVEQGMHASLENDLPVIHPTLTGISVQKIKKLLTYIASAVPLIPDMRRLKNLLDVGDERTLKTYLSYLEDAGLIRCLFASGKGLVRLGKPEKIFLHNPNQYYAIHGAVENPGSVRETFFLNALSESHAVTHPLKGDFLVDGKTVFEIGGKGKDFSQIKDENNAFLAVDDMELGVGKKLPLWLLGFLY